MADANLRALASLRRLRHVETDEARRELSEALAQETALAEGDAAMRLELDAALRMTGYFDREAFAAWLSGMRSKRAKLADALRDADARTSAVRTALAHRRVAETAAEEVLARGVAALRAEEARRDQVTLEDVSRALRRAAIAREST